MGFGICILFQWLNKHTMGFRIFCFLFSSRHISIMIINGKAFEGTSDYEYTDGRLKCVLAILLASRNFDPLGFLAQWWYITFYIHYINFTCVVFNRNVCIDDRRGSRVVGITIGTHIQIYWWNNQETYYSQTLLFVSQFWEGTLLPKFMYWTYGKGRSRGIVMIRGNVRTQ